MGKTFKYYTQDKSSFFKEEDEDYTYDPEDPNSWEADDILYMYNNRSRDAD